MKQLGVFAKYWEPGSVKTRLAKSVGAAPAAAVYQAMLTTTLTRLADVEAHRIIAFAPEARGDAFAELAGPRWQIEPQAPGDLGARMHEYFRRALDRGATRTLLIGSDSPTIPREVIEQAFDALEEFPVVLGPSGDGGYYLVGIAETVPPIFEQIDWSTDQVWAQTQTRLKQLGLPCAELPAWDDVDEVDDLRRLQRQLEAAPERHSSEAALFEVIRSVLHS